MAGYLAIRSEGEEFTVGDILALAAQIKRRKLSRTTPVKLLGHQKNGTVTNVEMRVPIKLRRVLVEQANHTPKKTPMRGAKRGKH